MRHSDGFEPEVDDSADEEALVLNEVPPDQLGPWFIETESGSMYLLDLAAGLLRVASEDGLEDFDVDKVISLPKVGEPFLIEVFEPERADLILIKSLPVRSIVRFPHELFEVEDDWVSIVDNWCESEPRNAWLLMGDAASMPTEEEVAAQYTSGEEGLLSWTCPKHIQPGDLVFVYFMAPEKAVRFVARALTRAKFDATSGVNSVKEVDPNQWWTILSPFVPIEPISFQQLEGCFGHKLILRGKPSHYVPPRVVDAIVGVLGDLDEYEAMILQRPIGNDDLPSSGKIGLAELNEIASGALNNERMVEEYIVEPLLNLAFPPDQGFRISRQFHLPSRGIPDFALFRGDELVGLVEAKMGIGRGSGSLAGCPEVEQIRRYCTEADLPGLLIDANEIVLIAPDAEEPVDYFDRMSLEETDIKQIGEFLTGWDRSTAAVRD
jgi:hypothetical protein